MLKQHSHNNVIFWILVATLALLSTHGFIQCAATARSVHRTPFRSLSTSANINLERHLENIRHRVDLPIPPRPANQRALLLDFFHATGGPYWKKSEGWSNSTLDSGPDECDWLGLRCLQNPGGAVVVMGLEQNNLSSTIFPSQLCSLPLVAVLLDTNNLRGQLPDCIGNLTSLIQLTISLSDAVATLRWFGSPCASETSVLLPCAWLALLFVRRVLLVAVLELLPRMSALVPCAVLVSLLSLQVMHCLVQPYRWRSFNALETLLLLQLSLLYLTQLLQDTVNDRDVTDVNKSFSTFSTSALATASAVLHIAGWACVVYVVCMTLASHWRRRRASISPAAVESVDAKDVTSQF